VNARQVDEFFSSPPETEGPPAGRPPWVLLALFAVLVAASSFGPADRLTWFLEVAPILMAAPVLVLTAKRFPLTKVVLVLIGVHAAVLALGGAYTYAEVPLGYWLRDVLGFERNPYDRIGHIAQGFVPALVAREILLRCSPLRRGRWLAFLVTCVALAISAFYEMIEWWAAVLSGDAAAAFLGTQGDVWDTQWDMFLALCGALAAQALLGRLHDRQLDALSG
jgi:putative membrane protein